jgi:kynurenine formamidase
MSVLDLTQPLFDGMPVFPGDPEVKIDQVHHLETEGWNLHTLFLTTHIGTHVNVPQHMVAGGMTLDDFDPAAFMGKAELYRPEMSFDSTVGVIFTTTNITEKIANDLIKNPPKFVGLSEDFEFDLAIEKLLLEHKIISFENLANTDKLPPQFKFIGLPLKLRGADGSPVRAIAVVP